MEIAHAKQYLSLTRDCGGKARRTLFLYFLGLEYNFTFARMGIP